MGIGSRLDARDRWLFRAAIARNRWAKGELLFLQAIFKRGAG
jgi:hypothetical protein